MASGANSNHDAIKRLAALLKAMQAADHWNGRSGCILAAITALEDAFVATAPSLTDEALDALSDLVIDDLACRDIMMRMTVARFPKAP